MLTSFAPVVDKTCKVLVLGSMPGSRSLAAYEYYAHPQNAFWRIMEAVFKINIDLTYNEKLKQLLNNRVALWDVIYSCKREGSLDNAIEKETLVSNDLSSFLLKYRKIEYIFCNGNLAYMLFKKHVWTNLDKCLAIEIFKLPSSSPANARLKFHEKVNSWRIIEKKLKQKNGQLK